MEQVKNLVVVIGGNTVKAYSFPTMDQANRFKCQATPVSPGGMVLVTRGDDGLRHVAGSFLVDLYNQISQGGTKVKKFEKKEIAVRRVYAALIEIAEEKTMADVKEPGAGKSTKKAATAGEAKAPKTPRGPSYHDKIREHFKTQDTATVDQVIQVTGADERNAKVAMGIIQNSKRVKNHMAFDYHRATKTYYLIDDGFGRKGTTPAPPEPTPEPKKAAEPKTAAEAGAAEAGAAEAGAAEAGAAESGAAE